MRTQWIFACALAAAAAAWAGCDSDSQGPGDDGGQDVGDDADGGEDPGADSDADADTDGDGGDEFDGEDGEDGDTIGGRPVSPAFGWILFNEVLIDGTAEGDPNGDGDTSHPFEDQFVELVNVHGSDLGLDGFTLIEEDFAEGRPRHTFPVGALLPAGHALVVFGGGDAPAATATAEFLTANADDPPGLSFGLHLSVPSDAIWLLDAGGAVVDRFCYGASAAECALPAADDVSLTRSPDLTGEFMPHDAAAGSGGTAFSPGTRVDGSEF
jgi:hypothetical protein